MHPRRLAYVVLLLSVCVTGILRGADFGTRDQRFAKVMVSRPPDQLLRGRTLLIKSQNGVPFAGLPTLASTISQGMSSDFTLVNADPDLTLTFSVTAQEPVATRTYTVTEVRGIYIGGVPVTYWEGHGKLIVQVSVTNRSNVPVDSFTTKGEYLKKIETAVSGKPNQVQLPGRQQLDLEQLQAVAGEIQRRYTKTTATVQVRLAVPDPLKDGLRLAEQNQWKEALAQWTSVKVPKNEAERAYNMAVANEVLFYTSDYINNPDEGEKTAQEAVRLYGEALRLDPKEKFFQQAAERSTELQGNLTRARQQWAILQREKDLLEASAATNTTGPGSKTIGGSNRPDTPDEADFRDNIRTRLRRRDEKPTADYLAELEKTGTASYKLQPAAAKGIVQQEATAWEDYHNSLQEYRQMLKDFVGKDKTLDAKERDQLNRFATRTQLSKEDVSAIEAEIQFTDQTRPAAGPAKPPARPAPQK
jgi:hypothetical protein